MPENDVLPLMEPPGHQLSISPSGHAGYRAVGHPSTASASISGAAPHYGTHPAERAGLGGSIPAAHPKHHPGARKRTPDELMAMAKAMEAQMAAQHQAQMAMGPAVSNEKNPGSSLERGVPPWLQDYMAQQDAQRAQEGTRNPYHPPQNAMQMTPEEKDRYGAYRPF